jgi:hypothetical protein
MDTQTVLTTTRDARPTPADALHTFYTTLQAMQGVMDLAQHAADHDDEASHYAHLFDTFVTALAPAYVVLAEFVHDHPEGGAV